MKFVDPNYLYSVSPLQGQGYDAQVYYDWTIFDLAVDKTLFGSFKIRIFLTSIQEML